jgi:hypothetical protein
MGAAFVTPDAIGFGFYQQDDLGQLQADLGMGLSANQAAGFSGSVYPLRNLRRVYVQEPRKRVIVEYTDMLLKDRDDFNFLTTGACREFCDVLLENLGPRWQRQTFPRRGFLRIFLPALIVLIAAFFLAVSVSLFFHAPEQPGKGAEAKKGEPNPVAGLMCGGVSLAVLTAGGFWLWYTIKHPPLRDMIQRV